MGKIDYLDWVSEIDAWCDQYKEDILKAFFWDNKTNKPLEKPLHSLASLTPRYRKGLDGLTRFIEVWDIMGIPNLEIAKQNIRISIHLIDSPLITRHTFENMIDSIIHDFIPIKGSVKEATSRLQPIEKERLDEAIHCYFEGCNYSVVAMSVCAIESRLLALMKSASTSEECKELDELPLGALIRRYLSEDRYRQLIHKKHRPLLELCNTYRVFSVHPKPETVPKSTSDAILRLAISFLLEQPVP
jgi:hypothetical protein